LLLDRRGAVRTVGTPGDLTLTLTLTWTSELLSDVLLLLLLLLEEMGLDLTLINLIKN
jgi:hypothetical protein